MRVGVKCESIVKELGHRVIPAERQENSTPFGSWSDEERMYVRYINLMVESLNIPPE